MLDLTKKTKANIGKLSKNRLRYTLLLSCPAHRIGNL